MSKLNASLSLYFISGFLFLIAVIIDGELLTLIAKPIIIPSILFYYFSKRRKKENDLFIFSFVLFFIGDMIYLINQNDYYYLGLFIFTTPYAIIIYHLYEDFKIVLKKRIVKKIDFSLFIVLLLLIYSLFTILNFLNFESIKEFGYVLIIGIELFLMAILTTFILSYSSHKKNGYLAFAVSMFVLSDVFFMLDVQFLDVLIFKIINVIAQTSSYYFYVKYFIERGNLKKSVNPLQN